MYVINNTPARIKPLGPFSLSGYCRTRIISRRIIGEMKMQVSFSIFNIDARMSCGPNDRARVRQRLGVADRRHSLRHSMAKSPSPVDLERIGSASGATSGNCSGRRRPSDTIGVIHSNNKSIAILAFRALGGSVLYWDTEASLGADGSHMIATPLRMVNAIRGKNTGARVALDTRRKTA